MERFDGMLLVSDYDNTLHYTEAALRDGAPLPPIHPRNLTAIRRWIDGGGRFAIATGRTLAAFLPHAGSIPMNAPAIVDNGGAIYDWEANAYLVRRFLPEEALTHITETAAAFPTVSLELYGAENLVQVLHPSAWNEQHAQLTGLGFRVLERLTPETVALPLVKCLFIAEKAALDQLLAFLVQRGWAASYELIFSSDHLLEMTARGASKGDMALRLRDWCGCRQLFCIGDHANDLPMLRAADRAFAPANAIPDVQAAPGVEVVGHCLDGAVADVIEALER